MAFLTEYNQRGIRNKCWQETQALTLQAWESADQPRDFAVIFEYGQAQQKITRTIRLINFHKHTHGGIHQTMFTDLRALKKATEYQGPSQPGFVPDFEKHRSGMNKNMVATQQASETQVA